jgi:alkylated DNA nucleotide flippase Atl1
MSEMQIPVRSGPSPKPRDASAAAQRLIDLANLVPAGEWVSYGDLADAYVVRNGANMVARGVASALSLRPADVFIEDRAMATRSRKSISGASRGIASDSPMDSPLPSSTAQ